jgi:hypothetical protein
MPAPSEQQIAEAIEAMTLDRGFIINSFAQIECRLADLIDQSQQFEDYAEINKQQLPFGVGGRVARVREMLRTGPFANHAGVLEKLLARFLEFEEVRHLFTHGFASFAFTPDGDMGMYFTRYVPPEKGQTFTMERRFYRRPTIHQQMESSTAFAEGAMRQLRDIYDVVGLDSERLVVGRRDD